MTCIASNNCGNSGTRVLSVSVPCRVGQVLGTVTGLYAQLFPNPVIEKSTLKFTSSGDKKYNISCTNVVGQRVMEATGDATEGINTVELNFGKPAKGVYTLNITCGDYSGKIRMVVE